MKGKRKRRDEGGGRTDEGGERRERREDGGVRRERREEGGGRRERKDEGGVKCSTPATVNSNGWMYLAPCHLLQCIRAVQPHKGAVQQ